MSYEDADSRSAQSTTHWLQNARNYENDENVDVNCLNTVHRLKASPHKIKTQTAKISYGSSVQDPRADVLKQKKLRSTAKKTTTMNSPNKAEQLTVTAASTPSSTGTYCLDVSRQCTQQQFAEAKQQRDEEMQDMQQMLAEMANKSRCGLDAVQAQPNLSLKRSHTEHNIKAHNNRTSRVDARQGSARQRATSQPQTARDIVTATNRECARQYMAQQRRSRRNMFRNAAKQDVEKDIIKQRLEQLKQNTKRIINEHHSRRMMQAYRTTSARKNLLSKRSASAPAAAEAAAAKSTILETAKAAMVHAKKVVEKANKTAAWQAPRKAATSNKRIGLLRKTATKDHSFSAIKDFSFEKENVALQMLTPQIKTTMQSMPNNAQQDALAKRNKPRGRSISPVPIERIQIIKSNTNAVAEAVAQQQEQATKATLVSETAPASAQTQTEDVKKVEDTASLVDWLKPSTAPVYPYNFIFAVRRKLDAILQQPNAASTTSTATAAATKIDETTSTTDLPHDIAVPKQCLQLAQQNLQQRLMLETAFAENAMEMPKKKTQWIETQQALTELTLSKPTKNNKELPAAPKAARWVQTEQQSVEPVHTENIKSISIKTKSKRSPIKEKPALHKSKSSISESNSNNSYSSISMQLPATSNNNSSHSKNKYIEASRQLSAAHAVEEDDTTTMSSSVFNSTSQSLKPATAADFQFKAPLPVVDVPKNQLDVAIASRHINPRRGDNVISKKKHTQSLQTRLNEVHVDFGKMLDDFNRNLSQVLEVNDQLKRSVIESHKMSKSTTLNVTQEEEQNYSSDFEQQQTLNTNNQNDDINTTTGALALDLPTTASNCSSATTITSSQAAKTCALECSTSAHAVQMHVLDDMAAYLKRTLKQSKALKEHAEPTDSNISLNSAANSVKSSANLSQSISEHVVHESASQQNCAANAQQNETNATNADANAASSQLLQLYMNPSRDEFLPNSTFTLPQPTAELSKSTARRKLLSKGDRSGNSDCSSTAPPTYSAAAAVLSSNTKRKSSAARSISSEIAALFKQTEQELTALNASLSESSMNYSNVGMYEQLIKQETYKTEQLVNLLRIREKSIMDRAKGQIAWLEVQKERYKAKGLTTEISTIKKKQRAVLLKMEKEREDIKRVLQTTTSTSTLSSSAQQPHSNCKHRKKSLVNAPAVLLPPPVVQHKQQRKSAEKLAHSPSSIIRASYDLESSRSLEELLQRRESDLRRRREQVERLMQWHQRLDQEEAEVMHLEHALLDYNSGHSPKKQQQQQEHQQHQQLQRSKSKQLLSSETDTNQLSAPISKTQRAAKMERRLKDIDKSLRELSSISSNSNNNANEAVDTNSNNVDYVRTSGSKLNKLWRRLTSQQLEKYEPNRRYKLCKADLERLYEEAKLAVLQDFAQDEKRTAAELLEHSSQNMSVSSDSSSIHSSVNSRIDVPLLELSQTASMDEAATTAESSTALRTHCTDDAAKTTAGQEQFDRNLQLYLAITQRLMANNMGIQRSLSDTQIPTLQQSLTLLSNAVSQRSINLTQQQQQPQNMRSSASDSSYATQKSANTFSWIQSLPTQSQLAENTPQLTVNIPHFSSNSSYSGSVSSTSIETAHSKSTAATIETAPTADELTLSVAALKSHTDLIDSKASEEINTKLSDISAAVALLSQANSLPPSYHSTKQLPSTTRTKTATNSPPQLLSEEINNLSHNSELSYSAQFEQISSDLQSPSGCILKTGSIDSDTFIKSKSTESKTFAAPKSTHADIPLPDLYEPDFESLSDVTNIADISQPAFETTIDTSITTQQEDDDLPEQLRQSLNNNSPPMYREDAINIMSAEELENCVKQKPPPPPPPAPPTSISASTTSVAAAAGSTHIVGLALTSNSQMPNATTQQQLMPDIINELEVRRCQQLLLENEQLKQYEHVTAVPYMYMREIPKKPPPPYVPPAHGSPMTTIFPSEERIRDITYRRTHELYCEMLKTDYIDENGAKLSSVMDEKITNIYERIILDICREYLQEHSEVLKQGDPTNFHSQLAFFNPPNRLLCIQESIYKEVRRCLAMDKTPTKRTQVYSIYGQRALRDHIGKIIIQEMYDEDTKWCNFHREESEVLELILEEMLNKEVTQLAKQALIEEGIEIAYKNEEHDDIKVAELTASDHLMQFIADEAETADEDVTSVASATSLTMKEVSA